MMKLKTDENRSLEFEASIQGVDSSKLQGSLKLVLNKIEYGFPINIGRESITVDIPALKDVVENNLLHDDTIVEARLDVFGEGFHLNPWNGTFHLKVPVRVEARMTSTQDEVIVEEPQLSIDIKEVVEKRELIIDEEPPVLHGDEAMKPQSYTKKSGEPEGDGLNAIIHPSEQTAVIDRPDHNPHEPEDAEKVSAVINKEVVKPTKSKEQLLKEKFERKVRKMPKKERAIFLKTLKERKRLRLVKEQGKPKTPEALMESMGMINPEIKELMLEKAIEMGGSDNDSIMTSLEVLLGLKQQTTMYEELAKTKIGKKILSE